MKLKNIISAVAISAIFTSAALAAPAVKPAAKKAAPAAAVALKGVSVSVKVMGDSTLHKWEALAGTATLSGEIKAGKGLLAAAKAGALSKLELKVEVTTLKSNEGKSMDKNMHKALEAEQFPAITFSLISYSVEGDEVNAKGTLTIHGTAKEVVLKGKLAEKEGVLTVDGQYDMLMSEYGIKPPVMMMGTVRVKDALTIAYSFGLAP